MTPETPLQPVTSASTCKCCSLPVTEYDQFCKDCGYPLKGTEEQQNNFIYNRGYQQMQVKELSNKSANAAITFYIIAGLTFVVNLVYFFMNPEKELALVTFIVSMVLVIIFLCLGAWSNKQPVPAIICGLSLYVLLTLLEAASGSFSGIIIKGLIIFGLVKALISALEAQRIKKQHNI